MGNFLKKLFGIKKECDRTVHRTITLFLFNDIIPSKDLQEDEYSLFLTLATPYELELDVILQNTYYKICKELNNPIPKRKFPSSRKIYG